MTSSLRHILPHAYQSHHSLLRNRYALRHSHFPRFHAHLVSLSQLGSVFHLSCFLIYSLRPALFCQFLPVSLTCSLLPVLSCLFFLSYSFFPVSLTYLSSLSLFPILFYLYSSISLICSPYLSLFSLFYFPFFTHLHCFNSYFSNCFLHARFPIYIPVHPTPTHAHSACRSREWLVRPRSGLTNHSRVLGEQGLPQKKGKSCGETVTGFCRRGHRPRWASYTAPMPLLAPYRFAIGRLSVIRNAGASSTAIQRRPGA